MNLIQCGTCGKLLAKAKSFKQLEIKCPRCKTLNHFALSVQNAEQETLEVHAKGKKSRGKS